MKPKAVVAMSGGVDSSVAAMMLARQGYHVIGLFMRSGVTITDESCGRQTCCSEADAADARRVADQIGADFYVLNFSRDFEQLISYFVDEYGRGRTPNPCIVCNRDLKFGRLVDYADSVGAEVVATGHYARVETVDGEAALLRGVDGGKDQSYSLFGISRGLLSRIALPIGGQTKAETRRLAREAGLVVRDKDESQEICFVAGDYVDLIRERRPELLRPGPIVDETGREVGRHEGVAGFTIGQRRGVRVAFGEPRYVTRIDPATATVFVGREVDLLAAALAVEDVNWLTDVQFGGAGLREFEATVQIRYRHAAAPAVVHPSADGRSATVLFREPQRAVTPGQAAVFYRGDRVLGGGWIARALSAAEVER
jgi:tRNA-specific 2-thiouridylase